MARESPEKRAERQRDQKAPGTIEKAIGAAEEARCGEGRGGDVNCRRGALHCGRGAGEGPDAPNDEQNLRTAVRRERT
jgi:hypothetical protein